MTHKKKGSIGRFLSILLAAAMALTWMPADELSPVVHAEETETEAGSTEEPGEEPAGTEKEDTAACVCGTLCTADSVNADCPVCGAEGGITGCKGEPEDVKDPETEKDTEQEDTEEENTPCTYACRICPIEDLIAALPEEVTADNAKGVRAQLDEILALYRELTEDEQDQLDLSRCYALQEALDAAGVPELLAGNVSAGYREAHWDEGSQTVVYEDRTADSCTAVTGSSMLWNTGWYVVNSNVTVSGAITVKGEVHLILADNGALNAKKGITVSTGNSLTIYGQAGGTGKLTATGGEGGAGIGGVSLDNVRDSGAITISGGEVTATGGVRLGVGTIVAGGAGIGGGENGAGSSITIYGGTVKATGGENGAGIGGGYKGEGSGIIIYGGTVTAKGGTRAAGIGGGSSSSGSGIIISGGMVEATGGENGAGIGGGYNGEGSDITISGGTVTAKGGTRAAGIGGGSSSSGSGITISGGTVTTTGSTDAAGIGGGSSSSGSGIIISGGTVEATGGENGAGIGGGSSSSGSAITISGGTVTAKGGTKAAGIGGGQNGSGSDITISGGTVTATGSTDAAGIGGGSSSSGSDITISGGEVTATGGTKAAGIGGGYNGAGSDITIDSGSVKAVGGVYGAGIGGGAGGSGSGITINDGEVTATGGTNGAGIGGGYKGEGSGITISGGEVTATGGRYGAGIGGGYCGAGIDIAISGGEVTAKGGINGAGIGGGSYGSGSGITISGGTVEATGGSERDRMGAAGIGGGEGCSGSDITISGGEITAKGGSGGAGIGGGSQYGSGVCDGTGSGITISGGTVEATGGSYAAGIGGGYAGNGSDITVSGGIVTAACGTKAAGIGGGSSGKSTGFSTGDDGSAVILASSIGDASNQDDWRGVIFRGSGGMVYGDIILTEGFEISGGRTLTIHDGSSLTIPAGICVTNEGTLTIAGGKLTGGGALAGGGTFRKESLTADMILVPTDLYYTPDLTETKLATMVSIPKSEMILGQMFTVDPGDWTLDIEKVSDLKYTATYTSDDDPGKTISTTIIILQSGTEFVGSGAVKTYRDGTETSVFAYGDTITVKATPTATGKAPAVAGAASVAAGAAPLMAADFDKPAAGRMAVYYNGVQVSAPSTVLNDEHTMTVDTADLGLTEEELNGEITLTVKYIASPTMADAESTVKVTVTAAAKVVKSGASTYVGDLQDAFVAVNSGATITMLDNVTISSMVTVSSGPFTLDLSGKTLTLPSGDTASPDALLAVQGGTFTIIDSSGGGKVTSEKTAGLKLAGGTLYLKGGSFTGSQAGVQCKSGTLYVSGDAMLGDADTSVGLDVDPISSLTVQLSGGFYSGRYAAGSAGAIRIASAAGMTLGSLLVEDYAYFNEDGTPIPDILDEILLPGPVTVEPCTHEDVREYTSNGNGTHTMTCRTCGYTEAEDCTYDFEGDTGTCQDCRSTLTVSLTGTDGLVYDGNEKKPGVTVMGNGKELTENTDYKVSYKNNINAGDAAELTVGGIGSYRFNITKNFTILPADLSGAGVTVDDGIYTGSPLTPAVNVTLGGRTLTKDTDYKVSYENNVNAGENTATGTVAGQGNYTGQVTRTFTIEKAPGRRIPNLTGSYTDNGSVYTYTIVPVAGAVYSMDGVSWTGTNRFEGIRPGTEVTFYAKIPEDENHKEGASVSLKVSFPKLTPAAPTLSYTRETDAAGKITLAIAEVKGAEYSFDGGANWQDAREQGGFDRSQTVTLAIRLKETDIHNPSPAQTVNVNLAKEDRGAPPAFTLSVAANGETDYTVTIPSAEGCEYSFDGKTWSDDHVKTGVKAGETVTGYMRYKETDDYNAGSAASAKATMAEFTVKTPVIPPAGESGSGGGNSGGSGSGNGGGRDNGGGNTAPGIPVIPPAPDTAPGTEPVRPGTGNTERPGTGAAPDIDFSAKTGTNAVPVDIVNNVTGERYSIQISLAYDGEFGFTAVLSLNLGKENAGYTASLYHCNESTGELEFICADEVAEDGTVLLAFPRASEYVIAIDGNEEEESGTRETGQPPSAGTGEGDGNVPESPKAGQAGRLWWIIVAVLLAAAIGTGMVLAVKKKGKDQNSGHKIL